MSDRDFPLSGQMTGPSNIDDLPRTLRREHEARAREAREREGQTLGSAAAPNTYAQAPADTSFQAAETYDAAAATAAPYPAVVKAFDVPFGQLVSFFIKAVLAAIPALLLLMVILWGVGQILETLLPNLLKMKILITFPNS